MGLYEHEVQLGFLRGFVPRLLGRADCGRGYSHLKFAHVTIPGPPAVNCASLVFAG